MATVNTLIDETTYVEIATGADALVQNISMSIMLYRFDTSLPAVNAQAGVLKPGQAIQKSGGLPSGNIYVRMSEKGNGYVSVS